MKSTYKVAGQDINGLWTVSRPCGNLCAGTWGTKESAQAFCDAFNNRKSSWDIPSYEPNNRLVEAQ